MAATDMLDTCSLNIIDMATAESGWNLRLLNSELDYSRRLRKNGKSSINVITNAEEGRLNKKD